jgi:hypothetical protein
MHVIEARREAGPMVTFFFVAVLAIVGFLMFTGSDGFIGPRH